MYVVASGQIIKKEKHAHSLRVKLMLNLSVFQVMKKIQDVFDVHVSKESIERSPKRMEDQEKGKVRMKKKMKKTLLNKKMMIMIIQSQALIV
jgi:hypothetical protein